MSSLDPPPPPAPESSTAPESLPNVAPPQVDADRDAAPAALRDEDAPPDEAAPGSEAGATGTPPEAPQVEAEAEAAPVTVPAAEWAALQDERADLQDRLLRLQAEFDNYRKRVARDRVQAQETATEGVTRQFLAVVDNCDRALAAAVDHHVDEEHLAGWRLIHQQLYDVLRSLGVVPMAVVGEPFDPRYHDALTETPHEEVPAGHIVAEVERGYMVGDRVLRTAKVAVSSGPVPVAGESA